MTLARFRVTDAIFNIGGAFMAAQTLPAEIYIAMNGKIFDPEKAVKNRGECRLEEG